MWSQITIAMSGSGISTEWTTGVVLANWGMKSAAGEALAGLGAGPETDSVLGASEPGMTVVNSEKPDSTDILCRTSRCRSGECHWTGVETAEPLDVFARCHYLKCSNGDALLVHEKAQETQLRFESSMGWI